MADKDKTPRNRVVRNRQIKETVQRHNQSSARKAQKAAKADLKEANEELTKAKEAYEKAQEAFKAGKIDEEALENAKVKLRQAQEKQRIAKKVKKKVKKTNPTIGQKARQTGRKITTRAGQEFLEAGLSQDDTLADMVRLNHQVRQTHVTARQAGKATGKGAKLAYRGAKGTRLK